MAKRTITVSTIEEGGVFTTEPFDVTGANHAEVIKRVNAIASQSGVAYVAVIDGHENPHLRNETVYLVYDAKTNAPRPYFGKDGHERVMKLIAG